MSAARSKRSRKSEIPIVACSPPCPRFTILPTEDSPKRSKQFVSLRDSLVQEKQRIEVRLRDINAAVNGAATAHAARVVKRSATKRPRKGKPVKNTISLKQAVVSALKRGPLDKNEILTAIHDAGYVFATKNPLNSLNPTLYQSTNPKFKRNNGKFSL